VPWRSWRLKDLCCEEARKDGIWKSRTTADRIIADDAALADSTFDNVDLSRSKFHDANMANTDFRDINLSGATFRDINLSNVEMQDCNLAGFRINGISVKDALDAYEK